MESPGDKHITPRSRRWQITNLTPLSYLPQLVLPSQACGRTVAETVTASQLVPADLLGPPARPGQMTLPKTLPLCQAPQISTCPVKNLTDSTLSQMKCKALS